MKKRIHPHLFLVGLFSVITAYASAYALVNGFHVTSAEAVAGFVVIGALSFFAAKASWHEYWAFSLSFAGSLAALGSAFGSRGMSDSPFRVDLELPGLAIFALSVAISSGIWVVFHRMSVRENFARIMLFSFILNWFILAINVRFFDDWKMENYLTVPFVVLLALCFRWFRLSNLSYGLIYAYMMLHIVGSHYTYAEVPFGFWLRDLLDISRNHYDRIVHFSFGLLLAYPIREMTVRISQSKGVWGLYMPVEFVLAFSAIYEILEWLVAITYGGDLGVAYLGTQGDEWDAIKDMAMAGLGSVLAMGAVALYHLGVRPREFFAEMKRSLVVKQKAALGEVYMEKTRKKK